MAQLVLAGNYQKSSVDFVPLLAGYGGGVVRYSSNSTPLNLGVMFVPQQEAWVVERMGKFSKILTPVKLS